MSRSDPVEDAISKGIPFDSLRGEVRELLGNSREAWVARVKEHCFRHQLRWSLCIARLVTEEAPYYEEMLSALRTNLMLYPYHLADRLSRLLGTTNFRYYCDLLYDVIRRDSSYDTIPNFTANDALRLTGVGRNEYIRLVQTIKSKNWLQRKRKDVIREALPPGPLPVFVDYWWLVCLGPPLPSDDPAAKRVREDHAPAFEAIAAASGGPRPAGTLPRDSVLALFQAGAIYFDVPVRESDRFAVPTLEHFVMNRSQTGESFERLLYDVFVSIDERSSAGQLAAVLDRPVEHVCNALSLLTRLGFAKKTTAEPLALTGRIDWHPSWLAIASSFSQPRPSVAPPSAPSPDAALPPAPSPAPSPASSSPSPPPSRVALVYDSTLTAFLMMGNLSPGLKQHAVTMFEVGRMTDEAVAPFLDELGKMQEVREGDGRRFYAHARALRDAVAFLRRNPACRLPGTDGSLDLVRCESLNQLEPAAREKLLDRSYAALVSVAPLAGGGVGGPPPGAAPPAALRLHYGPPCPEAASPWLRLFLYCAAGAGPPSVLLRGGEPVRRLPPLLRRWDQLLVLDWSGAAEASVVDSADAPAAAGDATRAGPVLLSAYADGFRNPPPSAAAEESAEAGEEDGEGGPEGPDAPLAARVVDVPFPLPEMHGQELPPLLPAAAYTRSTLHLHPTVRRLQAALRLEDSIGFVRMARLPRGRPAEPGPAGAAGEVGEHEEHEDVAAWVPLELHFGLPLFDGAMTRALLQTIRRRRLFDAPSVQRHRESSAALAGALREFVASHSGLGPGAAFGAGGGLARGLAAAVAPPAASLLFDGSRLRPL